MQSETKQQTHVCDYSRGEEEVDHLDVVGEEDDNQELFIGVDIKY